jgi:hypothetical protein
MCVSKIGRINDLEDDELVYENRVFLNLDNPFKCLAGNLTSFSFQWYRKENSLNNFTFFASIWRPNSMNGFRRQSTYRISVSPGNSSSDVLTNNFMLNNPMTVYQHDVIGIQLMGSSSTVLMEKEQSRTCKSNNMNNITVITCSSNNMVNYSMSINGEIEPIICKVEELVYGYITDHNYVTISAPSFIGVFTIVYYLCDPGYVLNGSYNATCTVKGTLDNKPPMCIYQSSTDVIIPSTVTYMDTPTPSFNVTASSDIVHHTGLNDSNIITIVVISFFVSIIVTIIVIISMTCTMVVLKRNKKDSCNVVVNTLTNEHILDNNHSDSGIWMSTYRSSKDPLPFIPENNDPEYYAYAYLSNYYKSICEEYQTPVKTKSTSTLLYSRPANDEEELSKQLSIAKKVSSAEIILSEHLGSGQFGNVYKGIWNLGNEAEANYAIEVAIKLLKVDASEIERIKFLQEAAIMAQFSNPSVLKLIGIVEDHHSPMLVMELMENGDLKSYLVSLKEKYQ